MRGVERHALSADFRELFDCTRDIINVTYCTALSHDDLSVRCRAEP